MDFFSSEIIFIVAVYLRLSKEDGDLDTAGKSESNSIQNQKALILNFLKKLPNVKIYDIYVDAPDIIGLKQNPTKRASL